ncbi:MAG: hypothetical protein K2F79_07555 [Muribaculaceae bacterium]|nr:hypothetical protein [Muribaculaceae bacterium]
MKKIITLLLALCLLVPSVSFAANKNLEKAYKKEMKKKMKEYEKEGWKLFGSSRTLEVSLLTHYDKLTNLGEDGYEVVGIASRFKAKNLGKQMAANSAAVNFAQLAGSKVRGLTDSDMFASGSDAADEYEHFHAAYERQVQLEIGNELQESYSVIRDNGDGTFELQTFYIVNENAAAKARRRAFENAKKETELGQATADKISKFISEHLD